MSDASEIRQKPSAAQFIANGDTMLALHHVDRLDARIDTATVSQVIDALRYWIGETHALREGSNAKTSGPTADTASTPQTATKGQPMDNHPNLSKEDAQKIEEAVSTLADLRYVTDECGSTSSIFRSRCAIRDFIEHVMQGNVSSMMWLWAAPTAPPPLPVDTGVRTTDPGKGEDEESNAKPTGPGETNE